MTKGSGKNSAKRIKSKKKALKTISACKSRVVQPKKGNVGRPKKVGYCSDCNGLVSERDIAEGTKTIYICKTCKTRIRKNNLLDEKPKSIKAKVSKKVVTKVPKKKVAIAKVSKGSKKISTRSTGSSTECSKSVEATKPVEPVESKHKKIKVVEKKVNQRGQTRKKDGSGYNAHEDSARAVNNDADLSNVKTFKFMGYCPDCKAMIVNSDLEEGKKTIYICPNCHARNKDVELLADKNIKKAKSKKAFLSELPELPSTDNMYIADHELPTELTKYKEDEWV